MFQINRIFRPFFLSRIILWIKNLTDNKIKSNLSFKWLKFFFDTLGSIQKKKTESGNNNFCLIVDYIYFLYTY